MLPIEQKFIDNNRDIRIPIYGSHIGISEFPCLTPICRVNKNIIIQVEKGNRRAMQVALIFKNIARIVEKEQSKWDASIDCYPKLSSHTHMVENFADMLGIQLDNYIPYMVFEESEIENAKKLLSRYDKHCVTFSPICGGHTHRDDLSRIKMLPFELWEEILEHLSKKYTILYIGLSNNFDPIKYTTLLLDLNIRELAAIMHVCKRHLGVENGVCHLSLAAGAFVNVVIPGFGYIPADSRNGMLSSNFVYEDWMWKYEPKRVRYHLMKDYKGLIDI